eukprot:UN27981
MCKEYYPTNKDRGKTFTEISGGKDFPDNEYNYEKMDTWKHWFETTLVVLIMNEDYGCEEKQQKKSFCSCLCSGNEKGPEWSNLTSPPHDLHIMKDLFVELGLKPFCFKNLTGEQMLQVSLWSKTLLKQMIE